MLSQHPGDGQGSLGAVGGGGGSVRPPGLELGGGDPGSSSANPTPGSAGPGAAMASASNAAAAQFGIHGVLRERRNWLINLLYVRQEYEDCKEVVEAQLRECSGMCEFAIYVKALICKNG